MCTNSGVPLTGDVGVVSEAEGVYSSDMSCVWIIAPTNGAQHGVTLRFTEFDLEGWENDNVFVDVCADIECSVPIRSFSFDGYQIPEDVYSETGIMIVRFESDFSQQYQGFTAVYYTDDTHVHICGQSSGALTASMGLFQNNDSSDGMYYNYEECEVEIAPGGGQTAVVEFLEFDTERNYDYVYVDECS